MKLNSASEALSGSIWGAPSSSCSPSEDSSKESSVELNSAFHWANKVSETIWFDMIRESNWYNFESRWDLALSTPTHSDYEFWVPEIVSAFHGDPTSTQRLKSRLRRRYEDDFLSLESWRLVRDFPVLSFSTEDIHDSKVKPRLNYPFFLPPGEVIG